MASTFAMCMNCGCNENDVPIYKCSECRDVYCSTCAEHGFFSIKCPECDSGGTKLGYIEK